MGRVSCLQLKSEWLSVANKFNDSIIFFLVKLMLDRVLVKKTVSKLLFIYASLNHFWSVPDYMILLWLTPDDFTSQGKTSRTEKSQPRLIILTIMKFSPYIGPALGTRFI